MPEIKAIETVYKSYRFRSRLEARWAVFFDALGIQYEYELEGYETKLVRYLPDFLLPEIKVWVEVKPPGEPDDAAHQKAYQLALNKQDTVVIVCGDPLRVIYEGSEITIYHRSAKEKTTEIENKSGKFLGSVLFSHIYCKEYSELAIEQARIDKLGIPSTDLFQKYTSLYQLAEDFQQKIDNAAKRARGYRFDKHDNLMEAVVTAPPKKISEPEPLPDNNAVPKSVVPPIDPYIQVPVKDIDVETVHMITVILRTTGDKTRDVLRLKRIHTIAGTYEGDDRLALQVFEINRGYLLEFPHFTTHLCPELISRLSFLVGQENVRVEPITFQ